jgi:Fe-S oxidoreductase/nitrate reductase gamma subunit
VVTAFDALLIAVAILIMLVGFSKRRRLWRIGRREDRVGDWKGLLAYLLGHREIMKRKSGMAHLLLFWAVVIPLVVVVLIQFDPVFPAVLAQALSVFLDITGLALFFGAAFFLIRRIGSDPAKGPSAAMLPLIVLLVVVISGFLAEGIRIRIVPPEALWASPVGWLLSFGLPDAPLLMQLTVRLHFFAVLFLIAILPFTSLRHVAAAPLNVYYRRRTPRGMLRALPLHRGPLGAGSVSDFTWKQLLDAEACVSCGRCEENCPASVSGKPLSPRKIMQDIRMQMERWDLEISTRGKGPSHCLGDAVSDDEVWACTTCMACAASCPVGIEPMDKIVDMRRYLTLERSRLPKEARPVIRNLELYGDVQGKGVTLRTDWAFNRQVPVAGESGARAGLLLWVGCSGAFHPRYQETARAMVRILKAGGIDFAILGKAERCCGDPARRLGEESLFQELARKNIMALGGHGVRKIVVLCPHCFNTLKNEYPALAEGMNLPWREDVEVIHAVEFVMDLVRQERVVLKYRLDEDAIIHDPCYLGRINGIYESPRRLMASVPGIRLKELDRHGENGFCCGGGGGRMWLHEGLGEHINQLRAKEVVEARPGIVGTACPYCLTMLEDGIAALEIKRSPKVKDIIEIVEASLG